MTTTERTTKRRRMRRVVAGLGAGSGAFAVVGAFSGSDSTLTAVCGAASGVLSIGAALLMVDCSSDRDIECGREEESVELQETPPETPTSSSSSSSEWSARDEPETPTSDVAIDSIRYSPNHNVVELTHERLQEDHPNKETLVKSVDVGTVSLGPVDFPVKPLEENSTNSTSTPNQSSQQNDYATSTSTTLDGAGHGRLRRRSNPVRLEESKQNLEVHMRGHLVACSSCHRDFDDRLALSRHKQTCPMGMGLGLGEISEESDDELEEEGDADVEGHSAIAKLP
ncbi:hypothetical protein V5O48_017560 [Marasmius crinis-equi]|uniref:C2H2-type domain-containing protein n=1 Tax=Marasmius crinis-equi TaxID=585013 RepID=A0ABR3ENM6_9AGAR